MREGWIIVTGASRGIGAAIATALVEKGARVAAFSRGGTAPSGFPVVCDVCDEAGFAAAVEVLSKEAPIIGLVNNAGTHRFQPAETETSADFEALMRVNVTSLFAACRVVFPYMSRANGGSIVNLGSFFDKLGVRGNTAYCASKAAVGAITRCLAVEWASHNIQVVNVAPGYVATEMNDDFFSSEQARAWIAKRAAVGRAGEPHEIARLVRSIFSDDIPFLTGETIYIDGAHGLRQ